MLGHLVTILPPMLHQETFSLGDLGSDAPDPEREQPVLLSL